MPLRLNSEVTGKMLILPWLALLTPAEFCFTLD
jgi:hypothetical protein